MGYKAVSDRIVLIPEKADDKIDGIIVPDPSKNKPKSGVVESVGPLCKEVKEGDKILFLEGHGALFQEDGKDKLVLREADVLCYSTPDSLLAEDLEFSITYWGDNKIEINKISTADWGRITQLVASAINLKKS